MREKLKIEPENNGQRSSLTAKLFGRRLLKVTEIAQERDRKTLQQIQDFEAVKPEDRATAVKTLAVQVLNDSKRDINSARLAGPRKEIYYQTSCGEVFVDVSNFKVIEPAEAHDNPFATPVRIIECTGAGGYTTDDRRPALSNKFKPRWCDDASFQISLDEVTLARRPEADIRSLFETVLAISSAHPDNL